MSFKVLRIAIVVFFALNIKAQTFDIEQTSQLIRPRMKLDSKYTFDPTKVYIHYRASHYLENKEAITVEQAEEILKNINDIEKHLGFTPTKLIRLTNKGILVRPKDEKWISNLYLFSLFLSVIRQQDNPDKHALASFYANPGKLKEKLKEFTGTILENWGKYNGHGGGIYSLYHD